MWVRVIAFFTQQLSLTALLLRPHFGCATGHEQDGTDGCARITQPKIKISCVLNAQHHQPKIG